MGQRGRKKGANGEQSKALLLSIAADEFANSGFYETKISTIVKRAGLSQPTFYLYFSSKEEVFQELVGAFRSKLFDLAKDSRLDAGIEDDALPERIAVGLVAIFTFFQENQNLTRIGFFLSADAEDIKIQLADQITDNLLSEQQDGYFRHDLDMNIVAVSLVGIIERLTVIKLFNGLKEPEDLAREIVDLFLYGLQHR